MDDAAYEQQKARVLALIERWVLPLGLGWWRIRHVWCRDFATDDDGDPDTDSVARCGVHWQYAQACIQWNLPEVAKQSDEELEFIFCHEMGHIFLHEMRELRHENERWLMHEEHVATTLAKAFLWLREMTIAEVRREPPEQEGTGEAGGGEEGHGEGDLRGSGARREGAAEQSPA